MFNKLEIKEIDLNIQMNNNLVLKEKIEYITKELEELKNTANSYKQTNNI